MPRYFFDLEEKGTVLHDPEGSNLLDDEAAKSEGLGTLGLMAREQAANIETEQTIVIWVRDEAGNRISRLALHIEVNDLRGNITAH
jgi:hypothetical protein